MKREEIVQEEKGGAEGGIAGSGSLWTVGPQEN